MSVLWFAPYKKERHEEWSDTVQMFQMTRTPKFAH